jgi:hypothetical protein
MDSQVNGEDDEEQGLRGNNNNKKPNAAKVFPFTLTGQSKSIFQNGYLEKFLEEYMISEEVKSIFKIYGQINWSKIESISKENKPRVIDIMTYPDWGFMICEKLGDAPDGRAIHIKPDGTRYDGYWPLE